MNNLKKQDLSLMKVRVEASITKAEIYDFHLELLKGRLISARLHARINKSIFPKSDNIPSDQQFAFAKLYKMVGYKNNKIRRYDEIKESFINEVNEAWKDYYLGIAHNELPYKFISNLRYELGHYIYNTHVIKYAKHIFTEMSQDDFKLKSKAETARACYRFVKSNDYYGFMGYFISNNLNHKAEKWSAKFTY